MAFPDNFTDTELSAVNQILSSVGQAPVTTLDQTNPDVTIAYNSLVEVNRELQALGWVFNTELQYPFVPDVNGEIVLSTDALQVRLSELPENRGYEVVKRNGKLYNRLTHDSDWSDFPDGVKCDVIWFYQFDDCPQPFKDYVIASASVVAAARMVGDPSQFSMLKDRVASTRATWMEYETTQGDYSMFGFPTGEDFYYSYQPFRTLRRY